MQNTFGRPEVCFDATNKQHREAFFNYFQTNAWGKSPTRFVLEWPHANIPTMIQQKMLDYYMKKDFNIKTPKEIK